MASFEALYGMKRGSPIGWFDIGEEELIGHDLVHQAMVKVKIIMEWLKTTRVIKSPIQIPYRVIHRIGRVAYRLELPPEMPLVHLVFHVSTMLKKVVGDMALIVPVETIAVNEELMYEEIPVAIIDRQVQKLRNKEIASMKVPWPNQQVEEATWEAEEEGERKYSHLLE
ncbi:PREDICTED: uncharacterized protein LOC109239265 [Nicotiana attenuata]|uniref:uncharacterized protein LOC109239265 n=1 Tax=Nicotiana attenuata TaxID=49451 RepID=UPI00090482B9|nr:PREDICTED: uncharacterized protein LOC109239265 [Nicotiana attenuata]